MRLETLQQQKVEEHARETTFLQHEEDERLRLIRSEHDSEMSAVQKKFAEMMGRAKEEHKKGVAHLEECVRQEILRYEKAAAELEAVRREALKRLALQSNQLAMESEEAAYQLTERAQQMETMREEHDATLRELEEQVAERTNQIESEQDALMLRERTKFGEALEKQALELKSMQISQSLTRQKIDRYQKEKEAFQTTQVQMERKAEAMALHMKELDATIAKLKREAADREVCPRWPRSAAPRSPV